MMRAIGLEIAVVLSGLSLVLNIVTRLPKKQRDNGSHRSKKACYCTYEFKSFFDLFSFVFAVFVYVFANCITLCFLLRR